MKKGVPRYFRKFTGKHLCQSLFFSKVASFNPATTLLRNKPWYICFLVTHLKFLRIPFFIGHLQTTSSEYTY